MDVEKLPPTLPNKQFHFALTWTVRKGSKLVPVLMSKLIVQIKNV